MKILNKDWLTYAFAAYAMAIVLITLAACATRTPQPDSLDSDRPAAFDVKVSREHFAGGTITRYIDNELDIVCYQIRYAKGISCLPIEK